MLAGQARWCVLVMLAGCPARSVQAPRQLEAELRAQTQAMLDAIAIGDAKVWGRYLDARAIYVSESGTVDSKATLLPQLTPLPAGITGKLAIASFTVERHGDTALVVYSAKESERYFGQDLTSEFLTTDTWHRGADGWRLVMSHVHVKAFDPPAITLAPAQLDEYVGTYRLTDAVTYTIRRDGDHLVGTRTGRPAQPLSVELRDVLFVAGQPRSRKLFLRDASGKITQLVDRREGHDIVWPRVAASP